MSQQSKTVNPKLVEKLTTILEQVKRGELTSFAAVTFKESGGVDQWGFLTRREDIERITEQIEALKQRHLQMQAAAGPEPTAA